jgi:hypothetical protein
MRLLIDGQGGFVTESREMPRAGLQTTARVGMDDTGARHRGGNGVSTQIGNDDFACLGTTRSNSRLNFLCHPPTPLHSTQELPYAGFFSGATGPPGQLTKGVLCRRLRKTFSFPFMRRY